MAGRWAQGRVEKTTAAKAKNKFLLALKAVGCWASLRSRGPFRDQVATANRLPTPEPEPEPNLIFSRRGDFQSSGVKSPPLVEFDDVPTPSTPTLVPDG